jgi:dTDP-4-amino-4,6-dideoxygalactose transaminase
MDPILGLARDHGLKVIEDCAQAHGASYNERNVGSLGDVAAFSFCQDKIMSTGGEGGMITTNHTDIFETAWSLKDHGKNYQALASRSPSPVFRWVHDCFATNARMTEMQAAMGRVLLRKLDERVAVRRENARVLTREFSGIPGLRVVEPQVHERHAYYKYYAFVRQEELLEGWNRDRIAAAIRAEGIPCTAGICSEIYLEKAFPAAMRPSTRLPVARELGETSLMFLVHSTLSEGDMLETAHAVDKVMHAATPSLQRVAA